MTEAREKLHKDKLAQDSHRSAIDQVPAIKRSEASLDWATCPSPKSVAAITSVIDLGMVLSDLIGCFSIVFYQNAEDAVFKALSVE